MVVRSEGARPDPDAAKSLRQAAPVAVALLQRLCEHPDNKAAVLHGIGAWLSSSAEDELQEVAEAAQAEYGLPIARASTNALLSGLSPDMGSDARPHQVTRPPPAPHTSGMSRLDPIQRLGEGLETR